MLKKMIIIVTNTLLLSLLIFSFIGFNVKAGRLSLLVTPVEQGNSEWCWAACAEMAAKSWTGSSTDVLSQWAIVRYFFGTSSNPFPDKPASIEYSAKGSTYSTRTGKAFYYSYTKFSLAQINNQISNNRQPIEAAVGYYYNGYRNGGHVVIISGVDYNYSNICYIDPEDKSITWVDYTRFCNGHVYGGIYDQTCWTY